MNEPTLTPQVDPGLMIDKVLLAIIEHVHRDSLREGAQHRLAGGSREELIQKKGPTAAAVYNLRVVDNLVAGLLLTPVQATAVRRITRACNHILAETRDPDLIRHLTPLRDDAKTVWETNVERSSKDVPGASG